MVGARKPGSRFCVELMVVAFGHTLIDVAHLDQARPSYPIWEDKAVQLAVRGENGFELMWVDGGRHLLLEEGQTIWLELQSVRFRARLVPRESVRVSPRTVDRPFLASLASSAAIVFAFLMLLRAQPAPLIDEDERRAVLVKLLQLEPVPREPIPGPPSEIERSTESVGEQRAPASSPLPRLPDEGVRRSKREQPMWAPASPAQAVGRLGRSYDPIEAARQAGIFGVLGDRRLDPERAFDPSIEDAQLWASTADISDTWMARYGPRPYGPRDRTGTGIIGLGNTGLIGGSHGNFYSRPFGEGVVGWGSYGSIHRLGDWDRGEQNPERAALCSGDCRPRSHLPRAPIVRFGQVDVQGALDRDVARRIVRAHGNELRSCFNQTITEPAAEFEGTIEFSLIQGKVGAVVTGPAFPEALAGCMNRVIRRWQFPVGSSQETNMVSVSLTLSR
jgi:hypothetical protein